MTTIQFQGGGPQPSDWDWSAARHRCFQEARRMLRSNAEAEDAVQEAMLRAWRKRASCRGEAPLPWLLQITRNEALRIRSRPAREQPLADEPTVAAEDGGLLSAAERLDVRRALGRLAGDDQALLELRYDQDLTQREVAEALNMPEGTATVRLHRLRKRLRTELGEDW
jgi:RNA polymerase sigma-70 factor, ECF subfamily